MVMEMKPIDRTLSYCISIGKQDMMALLAGLWRCKKPFCLSNRGQDKSIKFKGFLYMWIQEREVLREGDRMHLR